MGQTSQHRQQVGDSIRAVSLDKEDQEHQHLRLLAMRFLFRTHMTGREMEEGGGRERGRRKHKRTAQ